MNSDSVKDSEKVTKEVAGHFAILAKKFESSGSDPELVARFLVHCLFTLFAEGIGLLPDKMVTRHLKELQVEGPGSVSLEPLWKVIDDGNYLPMMKNLNTPALPLDKEALELLLRAAECDWSKVEPAIFGTLLERALNPKERHRLGAHFTPRSYVERLVRPTIEEPLREEWDTIRVQVRSLLGEVEKKPAQRTKKLNEAAKVLKEFHSRLLALRVLDPACGAGNFLYVAMDILKRLESEVLALLRDVQGGDQDLLHFEGARISPEQFLGIEIKHWAKEIADLVLWIGYLQWHFRAYGKTVQVPEPVLRDYKNIECRDAVLAYDEKRLVRDATGKPITRWDGETMKLHPVTGKEVPDETAHLEMYEYVAARPATWPAADFVVGNPPYIGTRRMKSALGDEYVDALRAAYPEVPETADLVMYWWHHAARSCAVSLSLNEVRPDHHQQHHTGLLARSSRRPSGSFR